MHLHHIGVAHALQYNEKGLTCKDSYRCALRSLATLLPTSAESRLWGVGRGMRCNGKIHDHKSSCGEASRNFMGRDCILHGFEIPIEEVACHRHHGLHGILHVFGISLLKPRWYLTPQKHDKHELSRYVKKVSARHVSIKSLMPAALSPVWICGVSSPLRIVYKHYLRSCSHE